MQRNSRTLSRRELYDLVWSKPIMKLATEFGISDRGLGKICRRHQVPVPPRGYWAKLQAGKMVEQVPFEDIEDPQLDQIVITASENALPEETRAILKRAKEQREETKRAAKETPFAIGPPNRLQIPHKLLVPTANALRTSKPDEWGACFATYPEQCGLEIHKDRIERVIMFLDRLFHAATQKHV
ncbi:MAG: hypothetical protein GY807_21810 [Gammaproteobacteria bacterium]|nr:hypothetical protein [Gammaproteobacteria bacterium]